MINNRIDFKVIKLKIHNNIKINLLKDLIK